MNKQYRKIVVNKVVAEWTKKIVEKIGHLNDLDYECLNKGLEPNEFAQIYESILRGVGRNCESKLKNTFARKERYEQKIAKES